MTTPPKKSSLVSAEINNSVLIMAPTGYGKSWLLATFAEYVWRVYKKVTLLYSTDGGGYPMRVQALVNRGIMRVWQLRSRAGTNDALALETTMEASRGYWPARINPRSGVCDPNARLVPPVTAVVEVVAPDGVVLATVTHDSKAQGRTFTHPTSKATIASTQWSLRKIYRPTKGFEDIGAVCFDGLTSCSEWWMDDLAGRHGRLELVSKEKNPLGGTVLSGALKLGGNNWADYGFAQRRAAQMVANARSIPHLVVPPVFTALTHDMDDEKTQLAICGPLLAGKKGTSTAGQWFGNVLEPAVYQNEHGHDCYRLYVDKWVESPQAGGRRHLTKNRADPGVLPQYLDDPDPVVDPEDKDRLLYPEAGKRVNLGVFFELLARGLDVRLASLDADPDFADAPGVPEMMEYGEAGLPETVAAVVTTPKVARPPAKAAQVAKAAPAKVTPAAAPSTSTTPVAQAHAVTTVKAPAPGTRRRTSAAKPVAVTSTAQPVAAAATPKVATTMAAVPAAPPGSPLSPATPPTRPPPDAAVEDTY